MGHEVTARRRRAYEDADVVIDVIEDDGPVIRSGPMLDRPIPQDRPVLRRVVQGALALAVLGAVLAWFFPGAL